MTDQAMNFFLGRGSTAARLAFTPNPATPAVGAAQGYFWFDTDLNAVYGWTGAAWSAPAGTGTVTSVAVGTGLFASTSPIVATGTLTPAFFFEPQGRLTLTSATPVLTASVTAATTIYYALYKGAYVPIWNGTRSVMTLITELSQATTDSTKSPAACTTNSNYDMFVWNDSSTIRCTRGPLWSSDTSRGSGAGTTQISRNTDGFLTNTVAITNGPGAGLGTYVGTIRTNGSSQVDYIIGGAGAAGGESTILGIWNMYNRVLTSLLNFDNTNTWNYTTATMRIKNGNNANKISLVVGLSEGALTATNILYSVNTNANIARESAIGLNSTTVGSVGNSSTGWVAPANTFTVPTPSNFQAQAPLGFNYIAPLEWSAAAGTTTWYGDNGGSEFLALFSATVMG